MNVTFATELHVDKTKKNLVKFISDAPIENFSGVTDKIDGYVFWHANDTLKSSEIYFEVDLNSIDTGIGLRNRHMRDNYLETGKYPFAKYRGRLTEIRKIAPGEFEIKVKGKMSIHGEDKNLDTVGKVSINGKSYHLSWDFEVKLTDYKIKVPKLMFLKIDEIIKLEIAFYLKEA